jgi:hypothetical protein
VGQARVVQGGESVFENQADNSSNSRIGTPMIGTK